MTDHRTPLITPVLIGGCIITMIGFSIRASFGVFQIPIALFAQPMMRSPMRPVTRAEQEQSMGGLAQVVQNPHLHRRPDV